MKKIIALIGFSFVSLSAMDMDNDEKPHLSAQQMVLYQAIKQKNQGRSVATDYAVLGLPYSASDKEIRKAYRSLLLKYHPDKNLHNKEQVALKFCEVMVAYDEICKHKKWRNEAVDLVTAKIEEELARYKNQLDALEKEFIDYRKSSSALVNKKRMEQISGFLSFKDVLPVYLSSDAGVDKRQAGVDMRYSEVQAKLDSLYQHLDILGVRRPYSKVDAYSTIKPYKDPELAGATYRIGAQAATLAIKDALAGLQEKKDEWVVVGNLAIKDEPEMEIGIGNLAPENGSSSSSSSKQKNQTLLGVGMSNIRGLLSYWGNNK